MNKFNFKIGKLYKLQNTIANNIGHDFILIKKERNGDFYIPFYYRYRYLLNNTIFLYVGTVKWSCKDFFTSIFI